MNPFVFHTPTRVYFGEDSASSCGDFLRELGGKKVLMVADAFLEKSGALKPLIESIRESTGSAPILFTDVPSDSDIDCVNNATAIARTHQCDAFVAVGGGSVIDTAKVINICLSFGGEVMDYQGLNIIERKLYPLIAVPTTAGTGAEVSFVAMVKDHGEGKKLMFGSRFLAPDVAILDPLMIVSLPAKLTAATGIDAITHDIECYVASGTYSVFTDAICLESLRLLFEFLPQATVDGGNIEARGATLVASCMAGVAFTNSGVGITHALAHAVGAKYATHHGMTNAVFLPHGMRFNLDTVYPRYARIAQFLGFADEENNGDELALANLLVNKVEALLEKLQLPLTLRELGVPEFSDENLAELTDLAAADPAIMFNPREASSDDLTQLLKRAY
ncbi:MAG: Iron-containing alcohol dehydrogenase [Cyanobacteriota bacterium erpe_2018_sw_21hr_WHONDRS-SW48-000092_B_bin.40]|jgi:alcohol dehydrogenase class IV|nr:Iron-containing alcohol dehydrogenase [Cyanobacteriota bacterium erpe_2018_sw_21hr_WHONDRS-SW48-000092_B_bin.40]